jgi:hypothetical protein
MRSALSAAALTTALAITLSSCGSGSSSSSTSTEAAASAAAKADLALRRAAESRAPKGSSPTLRAIYATFPQPKPNPEVKRSAAVIKAGEKACSGKTPSEVKDTYYPIAIEKGKLEAKGEEAKMIARIGSYEASASKSASFTSGQLGADAYQATLPAAIAQYGYQGCVYALAKRLEGELAPKR